MNTSRCEGRRRTGGAFSFGNPIWSQCEEDAIVLLRVKQARQDGKGTEIRATPACNRCWVEATSNPDIKIINVKPIKL